MDVVGRAVLDAAQKKHGNLAKPLGAWLRVVSNATWKNLADLRRTWRDTDAVDGKTIFNIKGISYRLIAVINYETQVIIIKQVLTHAEYSKGRYDRR